MRTLVISHDPTEAPALVGDLLVERGARLEGFVVCASPDEPHSVRPMPSLDGVDLLVVMGAPWSVYDRRLIGSWIDRELALLADAVASQIPVLGICFGAQALAAATGGRVEPAPLPELGWVTVRSRSPAAVPGGPWFQWHEDRFTLPPGAELLADNDAGPQAFRLGRCLGVQFHPEMDVDLAAEWFGDDAPDPLFRRLHVDPARLLAETGEIAGRAAVGTSRLLDWFLEEVAAGTPATVPDPGRTTR